MNSLKTGFGSTCRRTSKKASQFSLYGHALLFAAKLFRRRELTQTLFGASLAYRAQGKAAR